MLGAPPDRVQDKVFETLLAYCAVSGHAQPRMPACMPACRSALRAAATNSVTFAIALSEALARGMPYHLAAPESFLQVLQRIWWRLDRALDLGTQRVRFRRQYERQLREHRQRHRFAREVDVAADQPDQLLLEEVLDNQAPVVHRLGDHCLRELAVDQPYDADPSATLVGAEFRRRVVLSDGGVSVS